MTSLLSLAGVVCASLAGCSAPVHDVGARDLDIGGPVGEGRSLPAHDIAWFGTNILNVTAESSLILIELVPVGLAAQDYQTFYMPLEGTQGAIGIANDHELPAANRSNAVQLDRIVVSRTSGNFQLIVRVSVPPGGLSVRGYWLTYEVCGERNQSFIPRSQHVCDSATGSGPARRSNRRSRATSLGPGIPLLRRAPFSLPRG